MANLVVTNTFVAGTTILSAAMNTNFDDIENYINNRNSGAATWDRVLVTNASSVPLIANNGSGVNDIFQAQDNGSIVFRVTDVGSVVAGSAALATTAIDGFFYFPSCAGTPTGVPGTFVGRVPIIWDSTNNFLYLYDAGWVNVSNPQVDNATIELNAGLLRIKADYVLTARPAFLVRGSVSQDNVTGDGTVYDVTWNTEVFDQNSNFGSNQFVAPVTGKYLLCIDLVIAGITTSHTGIFIRIRTSNRDYDLEEVWVSLAQTTTRHYSMSHVCDMDTNDTAFIQVQVSGGTKVIDVITSATQSKFSGALLF